MLLSRSCLILVALVTPLLGVATEPAGAATSTSAMAPATVRTVVAAPRKTGTTRQVARTFYVSPHGSDSSLGRSASDPWRTLVRASQAQLRPGDRVRLRGGSTFTGANGLTIASSGTSSDPVVLDSYGSGNATISGSRGDCVRVSGSWVRVRTVTVAHCTWAGVKVSGDHVDVGRVDAAWSWAGVQVDESASYATVKNSYIHDNVRVTPGTNGPDDDSGAFGVLVNGDHTTVRDNTIRRHDAASQDYGRDGSAVEVFGAEQTTIEDNLGTGNQTFTEIGGLAGSLDAAGVVVRDNRVTNKATRTFFVVVHAGGKFGTASGVEVLGNSVTLTGDSSVGVFCGPQCTARVLRVRGNTISAPGGAVEVEGSYGR